jgi:hypothetical protein
MKTLITTLALATLVATSAFAAPRPGDVVNYSGKVIGHDPDANIRGGLMKDAYPSGD